jgi:hypothetical protein
LNFDSTSTVDPESVPELENLLATQSRPIYDSQVDEALEEANSSPSMPDSTAAVTSEKRFPSART